MIPGPVQVRPLSDWLHENEAFQDQNLSLKIYPHHPRYYIPLPKSHWGSWSSWESPLIALSLGFTVIRVLFRFLIERIFLRVLSDRVSFESSEIESSSLGYAVIDSSLYQGSFFRHVAVFLSNRVATFFIKNRCFVLHLLWFSKIISLTCFNNFSKTNSEKNEEIHSRDTKVFYWKYMSSTSRFI